jgi:thiamine-phosphate pyrophosphorylase
MPRLYLATPVIDDPASLIARLPALLSGADIAAVLLRLKPADERGLINHVKSLAAPIQNAGAALLLDGHVELVARCGADGAHLASLAALKEALPNLKPDRIAGVGGLTTRHESMVAGEHGADYVLFGEVDAHGRRPSMEAVGERLSWWAELFEPPCVGYATSPEEAHEFVRAGADFILVGDAIWGDLRGPASVLADFGQSMQRAYATARAAPRPPRNRAEA